MSAVLPSHFKIACPFCAGEIKVPAADLGKLAPCPHCAEEITFDRQSSSQQISTTPSAAAVALARSVSREQIGLCYLLSILVPLIGFVLGIYLLAKNCLNHGIGCMLVSLVANGLWAVLVISFL